VELLDEIIAAHGGLDAWRSVRRFDVHARAGGLLLKTRVPRNRFADTRLEVDTGRQYAVARDYPEPGRRGVFDAGTVRIESDGGEVLDERADARSRFFGRDGLRRNLRWDALDLVYFAGYAWWNYANQPLLLTREDVVVTEGQPIAAGVGMWRRIDATFPAGVHTHSPRQSFFYDDELRLRRHDYVAEVVGGFAHAAHMCDEHRRFDGLLIPTRRRVHPLGPRERPLPGPTLVSLDVLEVGVVRDG
jgi:hypothetical protein